MHAAHMGTFQPGVKGLPKGTEVIYSVFSPLTLSIVTEMFWSCILLYMLTVKLFGSD